MKEKERRQLFGEAVCGFVNAQNTDEAYFPILASIQKISRFSSSFIEKVKEVFPTMKNIAPPLKDWKEEREEMRSQEDKVLSALQEKLGPPLELSCNRPAQSLVISLPSSKVDDFFRSTFSEKAPFINALRTPSGLELLPMDFSEPLPGGTKFRYPHEPYVATASEVYEANSSALEFDDESVIDNIHNVELDLQEPWTRLNTIELHGGIRTQQEAVRELLKLIIRGRRLGGDSRFWAYLKIYNEMPKSKIEFDQQDSFRERYPISRRDYLSINLPLKWLDRIKGDLAYCLIGFLRFEKKENLRKCDVCSKFFVHHSRKWCSDECTRIGKKEYDTEYKQFVRWELFVDDVKKKCKTIDDLYNNDNTNLLTRARRFKCGFDEVIERLKKVL
jgi:hypothetical protein